MATYTVNNTMAGSQQNLSSSYKTLLSITAATGATTLRRGWLYEFEIGADGVPNATDCPISWNVQTQTAAGTSTAATALPVDIGGGDAAALLTYAVNYSAEGTYTAASSLFYMPLNQRASQKIAFRDEKSSLIIPAVNLKGVACTAKSPNYASTAGWTGYVVE